MLVHRRRVLHLAAQQLLVDLVLLLLAAGVRSRGGGRKDRGALLMRCFDRDLLLPYTFSALVQRLFHLFLLLIVALLHAFDQTTTWREVLARRSTAATVARLAADQAPLNSTVAGVRRLQRLENRFADARLSSTGQVRGEHLIVSGGDLEDIADRLVS